VLACAVAAALPWLTAAALSNTPEAPSWAQGVAVAAFAARAEPGLGTLGSLAGLGGMWNSAAVIPSHTPPFAVLNTAALLGVVAMGLPSLLRRPAAASLLALAVVSVLVPAALATGPGLGVLRTVIDAAPGLGVVRDGQKWVALAVPGYALAAAGAVLTWRRWPHPAVPALACCAALVLTLPGLAWGVWGKVEPVRYPPGWATVAAAINNEPGAVAVLPAGSMRRFSWSGPAPVLDPLPRWVRADVLTTGDLTISGVTVLGEGARARAVQRLLLAGPDRVTLRDAGVAWLVVESGTPGDMGVAATTFERLPAVYRDSDLVAYWVGGHTAGVPANRRLAELIVHLAWLTMLTVGAVGTSATAWRQHIRRNPGPTPTTT
jgi:hypothetical protein